MSKRQHEKTIFQAFIKVAPEFAGEIISEWYQPEDETDFPDIVCTSQSGRRIGVEIGEWLNEGEIGAAKGMERIQESILGTIGKQSDNNTEYIHVVLLLPKAQARVKPQDADAFRKELFAYIQEVDRRWPQERFWQSPQGFQAGVEDLATHPTLQEYLESITFFPSNWYEGWPPNGREVKRKWPPGQDWILFPGKGGSYSKNTMLQPFYELLSEKKKHYGSAGTGFDYLVLLILYNSALIYNSPVETPHFKFEDAVRAAKEFINDDPDPFHSVLLFIAGDEGRVLVIV